MNNQNNLHLTVSILSNYYTGKIIYHKTLKNKDGSPLRCRVNGKIKTWKTNNNFKLPVKYGFGWCFYITQDNYNEWEIV